MMEAKARAFICYFSGLWRRRSGRSAIATKAFAQEFANVAVCEHQIEMSLPAQAEGRLAVSTIQGRR